MIDLFLFTTDIGFAREACVAGVAGVVVDWETREKRVRQRGADTEINADSAEDLGRIADLKSARRVCRVNPYGAWTEPEVEAAVEHGATDLLLPMVEGPTEVERFLGLVGGRTGVGILVETKQACEAANELADLPLNLVYLGLNDLSISRGTASIFAPLVDGLGERVREAFAEHRFGMAGITVVDGGAPIPSPSLMAEMARLRCGFTFLRRSFKADIVGRNMADELSAVRAAWGALEKRSEAEIAQQHEEFVALHNRIF